MWCVLELNLSIVGGSMPAMKPVLQKYFPRLLASTGHTDSNQYYLTDTRSKPKRSRVTDPYNISHISRDRDSKSDCESERAIVSQIVGGKSMKTGSVIGASWPPAGEHITKTVEYGYQVSGDDIISMPQTSHQDEEAQMVRGPSPPRF
jgi:hypothetical protein